MNIKILPACFLGFFFFPLVIANAVTTTPLSGAAIKSAPMASDVVLGTDTTTGQTRNFQLGKLSAVLDWSAWPNGSVFAANTMVAYQGQIYKCLQPYTKSSGDTPAAFTAYWVVTGGGGTFDTAADQTITGDWAFSSGLEASNISLNLGTLADLKIGNAQMVDDTKGNGDTNFLWSADKIFDQLATKQATLVSGNNIKTINGNSLVGSGDLTISGGTGTSGYVALSAPPYSDAACTTGQYGYYDSTAYLCTGGFWTSKWTLTAHSNATPSAQTLTDSFTRAAENPLSGEGAWLKPSWSTGTFKIVSNQATITTEGSLNISYRGDWTGGGGQCSTITYVGGGGYAGPAVRISPSQDSMIWYSSGGAVRERVNGVSTDLGNIATYAAGDVIKLCVSGTTITASKNSVSAGPGLTATLSSGYPGIMGLATGDTLDNSEVSAP